MAGLGYKDFTAGAVLTAAQVDGYLMEQSVMNFAGTAARGSALSSVQAAGMMAHVGGGTVTVYNGSSWAQVYPSSGMTLITSGTLSGASVILSSIPGTYQELRLVIRNYLPATDNIGLQMRVNGDSGANRYRSLASSAQTTFNTTLWNPGYGQDNAVSQALHITSFFDYANTSTWKLASFMSLVNNATTTTNPDFDAPLFGLYNQTAAISSITVFPSSGNFTSGNYFLYGIG